MFPAHLVIFMHLHQKIVGILLCFCPSIRLSAQTSCYNLKLALQILGRKLYKNAEKSSLYSQSLLISIHKTTVVESHQITREVRDLLRPRLTLTGNTVYFYMSSSLISILKIHRRSFKHSIR